MVVALAFGALQDVMDDAEAGVAFRREFESVGDFAFRGALGDANARFLAFVGCIGGDEGAFGFVRVELFGFFAEGLEEVGLGDGGFHAKEICGRGVSPGWGSKC